MTLYYMEFRRKDGGLKAMGTDCVLWIDGRHNFENRLITVHDRLATLRATRPGTLDLHFVGLNLVHGPSTIGYDPDFVRFPMQDPTPPEWVTANSTIHRPSATRTKENLS